LEQEMPALQKEKVVLEEKMNSGNPPFDELQKSAERINEIIKQLDSKEMRWLELSERI
jgi:ATP-binding cassette subfamily F protein uup